MDIRVYQIIKQLSDLMLIATILTDDMDKVIEISKQKTKEFKDRPEPVFLSEIETWNRLAIRLAITTIESICFELKQLALLSCDLWNRPLTPTEREKLKEEHTNGRPYFLPTEDNLKFTFKMFAYAFDCGYKLDCSGKDWQSFHKVVEKRNGLTHPKTKVDLKVSPEEYYRAADAFGWFQRAFRDLMSACRAAPNKKIPIG